MDLEDGGEEARVMKMSRPVTRPSPETVRQHHVSHCQYRSWCPICVAGAADDRNHEMRQVVEGTCPEVGSDYGFMRNRRKDKIYKPLLVSKYRTIGAFAAHMVPRKGVGGGWIVQQYLRDLKKWGLRQKLILRSDGEPAIVDLLNRVCDFRVPETLMESSPVSDSRANGLAERAIQSVEKQVRVLKLALERNLGCKIGVEHACFPWLVEHAADVLTKFVIGRDGMTAWERLKGKKYSGLLFEFGTKVLHRVAHKPVGGEMAARWLPAVWLGKRFATDEHTVAMEDGTVVRTGTVREFPGQAFDKDLVDQIIGAPWDPKGTGSEQGDLMKERPLAGDVPRVPSVVEPTPASIPHARGLVITQELLRKVGGYTAGCLKCRRLREGDQSQPSLGHSSACRERVEALMQADPELRVCLQQAKDRQDTYIAKQVEAAHKNRQQREASPHVSVPADGPIPHVPADGPIPHEVRQEIFRQARAQEIFRQARASREPSEAEVDQPAAKKSRLAEADDAVGEMPLPAADELLSDEFEPTAKRTRFESDAPGSADPADPVPDEVGLVATIQAECISSVHRRGKFDVCEAFSPPRVALRARERGLRDGWSLDIRHADGRTRRRWNLADLSEAEEVFKMVERDKPQLVVLCPPCTKFCNLWNLVKHGVPRGEWLEAVRMVNVAVRIAELQLDGNRHFIFEHPLTASSWKLPSLRRLRARAGVCEAVVHMCMFGLVSTDSSSTAPAKKPTRILTSSTAIRDQVCRVCDHQHRHVQLVNGRASAAQEYTVEFCDAIIDGLQVELPRRGQEALSVRPASAFSDVPGVIYEVAGEDGHVEMPTGDLDFASGSAFVAVDGVYINDITGGGLQPEHVHEGRREELVGFERRGVYGLVSCEWAEQQGLSILGTPWVDKRKGDRVRSRLCIQYFNFRKGKAGPDDLFRTDAAARCGQVHGKPSRHWSEVSSAAETSAHGVGLRESVP